MVYSLATANRARAARRLLREDLPRLRLALGSALLWERLRGPQRADLRDPAVRYALQMLALLRTNRRPLRRLLARLFEGDPTFARTHPRSRGWFGRHPRIDEERWSSGILLRPALAPHGSLCLSVEQDPLEALRLGDCARTCFGLNGLCDASAAAVVLDVNKRVVYARDPKGAVIGRQLLAISEEDQRVPFPVYPRSAAPELEAAFLDCDLAFAEALGIELADGEEYPEIADILASGFWHDGAWELGGDAAASAAAGRSPRGS